MRNGRGSCSDRYFRYTTVTYSLRPLQSSRYFLPQAAKNRNLRVCVRVRVRVVVVAEGIGGGHVHTPGVHGDASGAD